MSNVAQFETDVNRLRQERERRMTAVIQGNVETPSEWDGWSLEAIYAEMVKRMDRRAAADFTDQIMLNRFHFLDEGTGRIVDSLDLSIASIPIYELGMPETFWRGE